MLTYPRDKKRLKFYFEKLLPIVGGISVLFAVILRFYYRGNHYVGWEILGPAHGQYLVNSFGLGTAITEVWDLSRHFRYWLTYNSLFYTVIPGLLSLVAPWEYYNSIITFFLFMLALIAVTRIADLPKTYRWLPWLIWSGSPVLVSYSLNGIASGLGVLPYAIALWMVFDERIFKRWWTSLFLGTICIQVAWQLHESGRTMFGVWIAGALLLKNRPKSTRLIWLGLAGVQVFMLKYYPSAANFLTDDLFSRLTISTISEALKLFADRMFFHPVLSFPTFLLVALVLVFCLKENKWFWLSLFLYQWGIIGLLALRGETDLYSRRFILMEFFSLLIIVFWLSPKLKNYLRGTRHEFFRVAGVLVILLLSNLAHLVYTISYTRIPITENEHPFPFTWSIHDFKARSEAIEFSDFILDLVKNGRKVIPLYNFSADGEWMTDPDAVLERVYVSLGHKQFTKNVFVFGKESCRYNCLPIMRIETIPQFLELVRSGNFGRPEEFVVVARKSNRAKDLELLEQELDKRFDLTLNTNTGNLVIQNLVGVRPDRLPTNH